MLLERQTQGRARRPGLLSAEVVVDRLVSAPASAALVALLVPAPAGTQNDERPDLPPGKLAVWWEQSAVSVRVSAQLVSWLALSKVLEPPRVPAWHEG